ncbi:MAG: hypothetical protein JW957_09200 [Candidatus Omnitrophica bacterium]|nr:hypothetical protein [Candidatus Omnitrophota bacterium]
MRLCVKVLLFFVLTVLCSISSFAENIWENPLGFDNFKFFVQENGNISDIILDETRITGRHNYLICVVRTSTDKVFAAKQPDHSNLHTLTYNREEKGDTQTVTIAGSIEGPEELFKERQLLNFIQTVSVTRKGRITVQMEVEFSQPLFCSFLGLGVFFEGKPIFGRKLRYEMQDGPSGEVTLPSPYTKWTKPFPKTRRFIFDSTEGEISLLSDSLLTHVEDIRSYSTTEQLIVWNKAEIKKNGEIMPQGKKFTLGYTIQLPVEKAAPLLFDSEIKELQSIKPESISPNPLYLNSLPEKPWWNDKWTHRLPVLITEPIGRQRDRAIVSLCYDFPDNISKDSIRIVTPYGEEVPSQVNVIDKKKVILEIVFLQDLWMRENIPLFIYYGTDSYPSTDYENSILIREEDSSYYIKNAALEIKLLKIGPQQPSFYSSTLQLIKPCESPTENSISNFFDNNAYSGHITNFPTEDNYIVSSKLIEDGPVRITIEYTFRKGTKARYSIYPFSPAVFYYIEKEDARIDWTPYGDIDNDYLFYETRDGIKKTAIGTHTYGPNNSHCITHELLPLLKEGWYAIKDERGEIVGELFDMEDITRIAAYQHPSGSSALVKGKSSRMGAIICTKGGEEKIRESYIEWKSPPLVSLGIPQSKVEINATVPRLGRESIRGWLAEYKGSFRRRNSATAEKLIKEMLRCGGNYCAISASYFKDSHHSLFFPSKALEGKNFKWEMGYEHDKPFLGELVEAAHEKGMGLLVGIVHHGDYLEVEEMSLTMAKELCSYDIDMMWLLDEYEIADTPNFRQLYKKTYREEAPDNPTMSDYKYFTLQNKVLNDLVKRIDSVIRENNPEIIHMGHAHSSCNLTEQYHDLDAQVSYMDTISFTNYSDNIDKFWFKFNQAAFGNKGGIFSIPGWAQFINDYGFFKRQCYGHLFWGANSFIFASITANTVSPMSVLAGKHFYNFLNYTGLGDILVEALPMKFVGVYRDREAFFNSIKKGERPGSWRLTKYDSGVAQLCGLTNIPVDVILSSYFNLENLSPYPILIIPNNPVFSDKDVKVLSDYAEKGGIVIIEGETIDNPGIQKLCSVVKTGEKEPGVYKIDGTGPLQKMEFRINAETIPIRKVGGEVLATIDNQDGIISRPYGKGKVIYIPLIMSLHINESEEVGSLFKELIKYSLGYLPLSIAPDKSIETKLFTDGERYIIGTYNRDHINNQEAKITINSNLPSNTAILDFSTGKVGSFDNGFPVSLEPREYRFYLLDNGQKIRVPSCHTSERYSHPNIAYSKNPKAVDILIENTPKKKETAKTEKKKNLIYTGIFNAGEDTGGEEGIYKALLDYEDIKAEYIDNITPSLIDFYDVIIIPSFGGAKPLDEKKLDINWQKNIREYVKNGGGVILCHNSVGHRYAGGPVFENIGQASGNPRIRMMKTVVSHPIITGRGMKSTQLREEEVFKCGYADHVAMIPGKDGTAAVKGIDANGLETNTASVIIGNYGKGKVVLSGMAIGVKHIENTEWGGEEAKPETGELNILVNSIYWMVEK